MWGKEAQPRRWCLVQTEEEEDEGEDKSDSRQAGWPGSPGVKCVRARKGGCILKKKTKYDMKRQDLEGEERRRM